MEIRDKLLYIRAKLNISQMQLAKILNVSFATISRWENIKSKPSSKALKKLEIFCHENKIEFTNND